MEPLKCYVCKAGRQALTSIKNPDPTSRVYSVAVCETCLKKHGAK